MALLINDVCISCDLCITVCPNKAISKDDDDVYTIDPKLCTECVGHHALSQCVKVCSVRAIVADPDHRESKEELQKKYEDLKARKAA